MSAEDHLNDATRRRLTDDPPAEINPGSVDASPGIVNEEELPMWNAAATRTNEHADILSRRPEPDRDRPPPPSRPTTPSRPADPSRSRSRPGWLLLVPLLLLLALGAGALAAVALDDDDGDSAPGESDDATATSGELTATEIEVPAEEVRQLLQGIGYEQIEVEERDGTLFVSGEVENQAAVSAVITATESLANGVPINTDGLTINPAAPNSEQTDQPLTVADPLRRLQVELNRTVATAPIIFAASETSVAAWQAPTLDAVSAILADNPGIAVNLVGYTDESGPVSSNIRLSLDRAESVRQYLIGKGIPAGILNVEARGESEATGLRDLGYLERRVEFEVVAAADTAVADRRPLDVEIVVPSASNDLAFSQSMVDAIRVLEEERGGLTTNINENTFDPDEAKALAATAAEAGSDAIILHGAEFREIVDELATTYPNVVFVTGPGGFETDHDNVFVYVVAAEQGAYVLGDLAGRMSPSHIIGVTGPLEVPEAMKFIGGFKAGAEGHGGSVLVEYAGSFGDVEAGRAIAESQVAAGADVLTGTSELTVGPIEVAVKEDLPWFGNQANQAELAPDNVVASQVYHFEVAIREILAEIDAGSPTGGTFPLTVGNGGVLLEFNPQYPLSVDLRERADELLFSVTAGSIVVNYQ